MARNEMTRLRWRSRGLLASFVGTLLLAACASSDETSLGTRDAGTTKVVPATTRDGGTRDEEATASSELPWEVRSPQGESLVPDIFYAEDLQNEQIMPTSLAVRGGRNLINRMIYPTLGNPSLYVRNDDQDSVSVVLRLEKSKLIELGATWTNPVAGTSRSELVFPAGAPGSLSLYLAPRSERTATENMEASVHGRAKVSQVVPKRFELQVLPTDAPAAFQARVTVRAVLRREELAGVPAGLYDLRYELRRQNSIEGATTAGGFSELAYNAVRIFDTINPDNFNVMNVTDTQVANHTWYAGKTLDKLASLVSYLNGAQGGEARRSSFILFNGDLHDGGSPFTLRQTAVASVYRDEAERIVSLLKDLPLPIVLTPGNHDGCASTGAVPASAAAIDAASGITLRGIIDANRPLAWPSFDWNKFAAATAAVPANGRALDLFGGAFQRRAGSKSFAEGWTEVPRANRNYLLYDGFQQWQRSYGPLYFSFRFGHSSFLSLNTYELRQHMRTGWGMYTVNYGGGMSSVQLEWLNRELTAAQGTDVVLSAHHDPRGGHMNLDRGYYYPLLAYNGVPQSLFNYTNSEVINPLACKLPNWALSTTSQTSCLHDGLQEWMAPDLDYDCSDEKRSAATGKCDAAVVQRDRASTYRFSAMELMDTIANATNVRTMVLGHTHTNSLEVLAPGDSLAPDSLTPAQLERMASLEVSHPTRGYAWQANQGSHSAEYTKDELSKTQLEARMAYYLQLYEAAARRYRHTLGDHELVIIRTTSLADLTPQKHNDDTMMGFSLLGFSPQRGTTGRLNAMRYFQYRADGIYSLVADDLQISRQSSMDLTGPNNPLNALFE